MIRIAFLRRIAFLLVLLLGLPIIGRSADTTPLYVKGLVMVDITDPAWTRLCMPDASNHKPTLTVMPYMGVRQTINIKGSGQLITNIARTNPILADNASTKPLGLPAELIRMKEIYGPEVKTKLDGCPTLISIPTGAIKAVTTMDVSKSKYTFVRVDNAKEVDTFRPRQVAMEIRLDLASDGILVINSKEIQLTKTRELRLEYLPDRHVEADPFIDHFHTYLAYIERPAALDFDVVPKNLNYSTPALKSKAASRFVPLDNIVFCYLIAVP